MVRTQSEVHFLVRMICHRLGPMRFYSTCGMLIFMNENFISFLKFRKFGFSFVESVGCRVKRDHFHRWSYSKLGAGPHTFFFYLTYRFGTIKWKFLRKLLSPVDWSNKTFQLISAHTKVLGNFIWWPRQGSLIRSQDVSSTALYIWTQTDIT